MEYIVPCYIVCSWKNNENHDKWTWNFMKKILTVERRLLFRHRLWHLQRARGRFPHVRTAEFLLLFLLFPFKVLRVVDQFQGLVLTERREGVRVGGDGVLFVLTFRVFGWVYGRTDARYASGVFCIIVFCRLFVGCGPTAYTQGGDGGVVFVFVLRFICKKQRNVINIMLNNLEVQ